MMQAVLAYRLDNAEAARACALKALQINEDLLSVVDELMPEFTSMGSSTTRVIITGGHTLYNSCGLSLQEEMGK